jgi:hypothetical protein
MPAKGHGTRSHAIQPQTPAGQTPPPGFPPRCVGLAHLRWAMRNPDHFKVISSRRLFDHHGHRAAFRPQLSAEVHRAERRGGGFIACS